MILRAEESSNDMYLSIDHAVDKIESQLRRYRTKLDQTHSHGGARACC